MMKTKKMRCLEVSLVAGLMIVMLCSVVSALGFSSSYGVSNPLQMYAGESRDVEIGTLQSANANEMEVGVSLEESEGIAEVDEGEIYLVSSAKEAPALVNIEIPEDAVIGQEYVISLRYWELNPETPEGGTVGLTASSASVGLRVFVVEKPAEIKPEGIGLIWWILGIVVVIIVIVLIWFGIKSKKETSAKKEVLDKKETPAKDNTSAETK